MALEGFLGKVDGHYGLHKWMSSFSRLEWRPPPRLFFFYLNPTLAFLPCLLMGEGGDSLVVYPPLEHGKEPMPINNLRRHLLSF